MRRDFLEPFSEEQIRVAVLNGIRTAHSQQSIFSYRWITAQLASVLFLPGNPEVHAAAVRNWPYFEQNPGISDTNHDVENHDSLKIMSVLWRMVNDGIFYPRYQSNPNPPTSVLFCLTMAGKRLIANLPEHPHNPGFADAFKRSAAKRDPDVIACFDNAVECFRRGIFRASMMLIGVAAEITARAAYEALVRNGTIAHAGGSPAAEKTLIRLRTVTAGQTHQAKEIQTALVSLDLVRDKRNSAAHPEREEFSSSLIEQMLAISAKAIPTIWELVVEPEITNNGFVWPPP